MQNAAIEKIHTRAFEHLVKGLYDPSTSKANQDSFNAERLQRVKDSFQLRPQFLPVQITMPAGVQVLPISATTNELKFDVVIVGIITDGEDKQINMRRDQETGTPFVSTGVDAGARLSLDAIAGKSLETGGLNGIQPLTPFLLRKGEGITFDVFKPLATADAEIVSICLIGYRVMSNASANELFTPDFTDYLQKQISRRPTPEPRFSVCPVNFVNGRADAETPKVNEPRLILGFRSTVKDALCNVGFDRDNAFSRDYFPIWAIASEAGVNFENYRLLRRPIFLEANQQLYFSLINSINNLVFAVNGNIEVLETTL